MGPDAAACTQGDKYLRVFVCDPAKEIATCL